MITNVIRVYHDDMAHCGMEKTLQGITCNYWFPSRKRIRLYIDNCLICLIANSASNSCEELQISENLSSPFQTIRIDHFGPIVESEQGFKPIFVVVDAFTRFTWLYPVKTTGPKEIIKYLISLFHVFGNPQIKVSDRETA